MSYMECLSNLNSSCSSNLSHSLSESDYSYFNDPDYQADNYLNSHDLFSQSNHFISNYLHDLMIRNDNSSKVNQKTIMFTFTSENYPTFIRHFVNNLPDQQNQKEYNNKNTINNNRKDSCNSHAISGSTSSSGSSNISNSNIKSSNNILVSISITGVRKVKARGYFGLSYHNLEYNFLFYIDNQSYTIWKSDYDVISLLSHINTYSTSKIESNMESKSTSRQEDWERTYQSYITQLKHFQYWLLFSIKSYIVFHITHKYSRNQLSYLRKIIKDIYYEIPDMDTLLVFLLGRFDRQFLSQSQSKLQISLQLKSNDSRNSLNNRNKNEKNSVITFIPKPKNSLYFFQEYIINSVLVISIVLLLLLLLLLYYCKGYVFVFDVFFWLKTMEQSSIFKQSYMMKSLVFGLFRSD